MISDNQAGERFRRRASALATSNNDPGVLDSCALPVCNERIVHMDSGHLSAGSTVDAILMVRGHFSCGAHCNFLKPVYVGGNCEIGKGSRLESITADGSLMLCSSVEVRGWASSGDGMEIRAGCRIGQYAVSKTAIRLSAHAEAPSLQAPVILTESGAGCEIETLESAPMESLEIKPPGNRATRPALGRWNINTSKLYPLGADTWIYDGSLHLSAPVILRAHLVTEGAFSCPAGSLLESDVRASGGLCVGPRSVCRGNLTANGDLVVGPGSVFQGHVHGKQIVRLSAGVRGLRAGGPVQVHAGGNLLMEGDVLIRGSLQSGCRVAAVHRAVPELLTANLRA